MEAVIGLGFGLFLSMLSFVLIVLSLMWAFADAEARGKSGCLVALLVFLLWPVSLLIWIVFRPEHRARY